MYLLVELHQKVSEKTLGSTKLLHLRNLNLAFFSDNLFDVMSSKSTPWFKSHRRSISDDPIQIIYGTIMHLILFLYIGTVRILQKKVGISALTVKRKKKRENPRKVLRNY